MLGICWREKTSNETIRQRVNREETVIDIIYVSCFSDISATYHSDDRLMKTVLLGSVDGLRQRGKTVRRGERTTSVTRSRIVFGPNGRWPSDKKKKKSNNNNKCIVTQRPG